METYTDEKPTPNRALDGLRKLLRQRSKLRSGKAGYLSGGRPRLSLVGKQQPDDLESEDRQGCHPAALWAIVALGALIVAMLALKMILTR